MPLIKLNDLLESVNLIQHVEIPTHRRGHTLDLTITRKEEHIMADVSCACRYLFLPQSNMLQNQPLQATSWKDFKDELGRRFSVQLKTNLLHFQLDPMPRTMFFLFNYVKIKPLNKNSFLCNFHSSNNVVTLLRAYFAIA